MKINLNKINNNFNNVVNKCKIKYNNFVAKQKGDVEKYRKKVKSRQAEILYSLEVDPSLVITLIVLNIFIFTIFNDSSLIDNISSGLYNSFIGYLISVFTGVALDVATTVNTDGQVVDILGFLLSVFVSPVFYATFNLPWYWPMIVTYLIPFYNFYYNLI